MEEPRGFLWSNNCGFGKLINCYEDCKGRAGCEGQSVSFGSKYLYMSEALMCTWLAVSDAMFKALQRQDLDIIQPRTLQLQ